MYRAAISVRNLVESVLASGDIGGGAGMMLTPERAQEGSRVHRSHQEMRLSENSEYRKEVFLKKVFPSDDIEVTVEGRADGILTGEYIEEIKSTYKNLSDLTEDYNEIHWAQVKFYGFIYAQENNLTEITLKLTYYQIEKDEFISFDRTYSTEELRDFTDKVLSIYRRLKMLEYRWREERDRTIKEAEFPFPSYRPGQRKMAVSVYNTIKEEKKIFIQAPTGIGKTISALFPAVKALKEKKTDRIFYLAPKSTAKEIGENSVEILRSKGTKLRSITLTSKEKICFMDEVRCEPDYCPYAKGYYDRVKEGIIDILENEDSLKREVIEEYARKHMLCPFEFSLDLSLYADIIIGDYNYAFDPRVFLKRFFLDRHEKYTFLIDEAHNLLDRSRDMFSAEIKTSWFLKLGSEIKIHEPKIAAAALKISEYMEVIRERNGDPQRSREENPDRTLSDLTVSFTEKVSSYLADETRINEREDFRNGFPDEWNCFLEVFFESLAFVRILDLYSSGHISYSVSEGDDFKYKLFCADPSSLLGESYERADSLIFFSATLSPMDYYMKLYSADEDDYRMMLPSPFPKDNLKVFLDTSINTRYTARDKSYDAIAKNLMEMTRYRKGNYMAFFPSYRYMESVYEIFTRDYEDVCEARIQESGLSEKARNEVIESFSETYDRSYLYFMVLGGVFAEGIDLKGDMLIGTALIGLGYPTFNFEREIIQDYFQKESGDGFSYAYTYPGLNKITQAGGRVIRTEEDEGIILLMDDRYKNEKIRRLLPENWFPLMSANKLNTYDSLSDEDVIEENTSEEEVIEAVTEEAVTEEAVTEEAVTEEAIKEEAIE